MIIVKNPGYLIYKNSKFRCSLGVNGIKNKKKEGDGITPKGVFKLKKIYYLILNLQILSLKLIILRQAIFLIKIISAML